jgi:RNA polymerase sigma factor (sigma-70 family)
LTDLSIPFLHVVSQRKLRELLSWRWRGGATHFATLLSTKDLEPSIRCALPPGTTSTPLVPIRALLYPRRIPNEPLGHEKKTNPSAGMPAITGRGDFASQGGMPMASGRMRGVVRRLRQTVLRDGAALSDADLLQRYLASREEEAFAALVRRHGPMVLGVCRRILRNSHDADDAFQATFLVLVRKAHTIVPRERVGAWLYGVAYRTSTKAQAMNFRRRTKQKSLVDVPAPDSSSATDWLALLDQEVNRLPEKYRLPVVLCDLEGKTRKQAAQQIGWPEGTVATRLQHGRALVHKRLLRHGLPCSAGAATLAWTHAVSAASVPAPLVTSTVQTASLFAAGKMAGLVPLKILALTQGVLQAMVLNKIKNATAVVLFLGVLGLSLGGFAGGSRHAAAAQTGDDPTKVTKPAMGPTPIAIDDPLFATGFVDSGTVERSESRLPTGPMPQQVLVSLHKDTIVVKTNQLAYIPVTTFDNVNNRATTSYRLLHTLNAERFSRYEVGVFDIHQRQLHSKEVEKLLKEELPALLLRGGPIDPLHLRLYKEDTLIFVVPAPVRASTVGQSVPIVPPVAATASLPATIAPPPPPTGYYQPTPPVLSYPLPTSPLPSAPAAPPAALPTPPTGYYQATPPLYPPPTEVRIDQAERDLAVAEFYLKAGHRGSAVFYYELIERRYPGTSYAQRAARFLRDLRPQKYDPPPQQQIEWRVGQIFIVGDDRVPDAVIRKNLEIYPGQMLDYKALRAAEQKLRSLKEFANASPIVSLRPSVTVLEDGDAPYKDILVCIQESLRTDVLDEMRKLEGTWTVAAAKMKNVDAGPMIGKEFIFAGDQVSVQSSPEAKPSSYTLDLTKRPKKILITRSSETPMSGTYELAGDTLKLSMFLDGEAAGADNKRQVMELTLRRKRTEGAQPAPPLRLFDGSSVQTQRTDVVAEMKRLEGRWLVKTATLDGKEVSTMKGREFIFAGNQVITNPGAHESRNQYVLDLSENTPRIRLIPLDLPNARQSSGTYAIDGDLLSLKLSTDRDNSAARNTPGNEMILTLQRKQPTAQAPPPSATGKEPETSRPAPGNQSASAPIQLEFANSGLKISAAAMSIDSDGRVLFKKAFLRRVVAKDGAEQVLSGESILLRMDGPVRNIADLEKRQILSFQIDNGFAFQIGLFR